MPRRERITSRPSARLELYCDDTDPVCQMYKRHIEEAKHEIRAKMEVDPLATLTVVVMERHGLNPVCSPPAKSLARKFIEYHKALKKLEYIAKRHLDHPLLAREARYEAEMATAIVAAIGYICYDKLDPARSRLDAEILDAMIRARAMFNRCDRFTDEDARQQCILNTASMIASGSDYPDLIASYLAELDKLMAEMKQAAGAQHRRAAQASTA